MEDNSVNRKLSRPNQDGDSNSEARNLRPKSNALPLTKPTQDGDADGAGNVDKALSSSDTSNENIRKPRKYKKRIKRRVVKIKTKKIDDTTCQPDYEPEPMVEIQKPPKIESPESEIEIIQPRFKKSEKNPPISNEIVPVPEEKKWIRLKKAVKSTITRQFDRLSSKFVLDFPPQPPPKTESELEIILPENNPPRVALKTNTPEPRVEMAVEIPAPAVKTAPVTVTPRKFSILDLRKSRAERGVKSLNIKMGWGFVLRKEPIRRNPKGILGKFSAPQSLAKPAALPLPVQEMPKEPVQYRQQPKPESMSFPSSLPLSYIPPMTFDIANRSLTSSQFSQYGNQFAQKPIMNGFTGNTDRGTKSAARFDDKTEIPTLQYYPKTPFTAQFAHLLPISRY